MIKKEIILHSTRDNRAFSVDYRYEPDGRKKPVMLFLHGFKGFKDAMHFNALADEFAKQGFVYVKMNVSHNGTTPEYPQEFVDLDAFGNNNFSTELDDMKVVIDYILNENLEVAEEEIDLDELYLIGHSRGGSVSVLKACEDSRVKKLVTLAAVPDLGAFWSDDFMSKWEKAGVQHILNARTLQEMPLYYQMVEDYQNNGERFYLGKQLRNLKIPFMAIHGTKDETVPVQSLEQFKQFYPKIETHIITEATHTFGGKHPWKEVQLPDHSLELVEKVVLFLKK